MAKSFSQTMKARYTHITTSYAKINGYVHETAMMILRHAVGEGNGDVSEAQRLINAMPQSTRKLALINWFSAYSPIVVKDDNAWNSKARKPEDKLYRPFDIDGAEANPWFTVADKMGAEKPPITLLDMKNYIEQQAKMWEKRAEDDKIDPREVLSALALAKQLRSIKVQHVEPENDDQQPPLQAAG